jgi:phosphoglycolate phosphatase
MTGVYMLQEIDIVLFDFDGTLVEIDIDFAQMRQGVFALGIEYGVSAEPGLYVLESLEDIFEKLQQLDVNQARDFKQRAKRLIASIEVEAATRSRAMPGAKRTLRELKSRGIKIGIVTRNCRSGVMKSAEKADFVYDLTLTRDDVEKVKPDPQHLLDALNILNSKPGKSIMVGDHPMDILAGKRAGMKTAAVLTSKSVKDFEEVAPDLILTGVAGILDIL